MRSSGVKSSLWSLISIIVIAGMILGWARANEIKSLGDVWNYASAWSDKLSSCYSDTEALTWDCSEEANPSGEGKDEPSGPVEISEKEYTEYEKKLNSLSVADRKRVDYNRAQWVHWSDLDGNGCNTRQDVLIKQGKKVKTDPNDKCKAVSGKWTSIYDGKEFTTPGGLDIDHVIPLYYAASQGGQSSTLR